MSGSLKRKRSSSQQENILYIVLQLTYGVLASINCEDDVHANSDFLLCADGTEIIPVFLAVSIFKS